MREEKKKDLLKEGMSNLEGKKKDQKGGGE